MGGKQSGLKADFEVYESHRREWLAEHEGKYVLIHKRSVVGFYPDYADGLQAGIKQFGPQSEFLIQQICVEEPVFVIY